MTADAENERIIGAANEALTGIVAALDPESQPMEGGWVAVTVHAPAQETGGAAPIIQRSFYTWHHEAPPEPLDEAEYMELTRDAETGHVKAPAWGFDLTPADGDDWRLDYWFGAPLRLWMGEKVGDRVMGQGLGFLARRTTHGWELEFEDILAS
jgi:hypothetical protein